MARKGWQSLSPAYKKRLEGAGITQSRYEAGESLSKARGHSKTPEHARGPISRAKYPEYVKRREELMRKVDERKREAWGDRPRWDEARARSNLRKGPPSNKELEWALQATDEELLDALRDTADAFRWLGYH